MENVKRVRADVGKIYFSGRHNNDTPDPTLWGALNAVTAYVDHEQDLPDADRYSYIMFGEGTRVKELAYKKALEAAAH